MLLISSQRRLLKSMLLLALLWTFVSDCLCQCVHLKFLSDLAREICHGLSFLSRKLGKENCLNEWTYLAEYIIYIVVIHTSFLLDAFGIRRVGQIRRLFGSNERWSSQQHLCIACLWHLRSSHWIWILLCQLWVSCVITEVIFTTA